MPKALAERPYILFPLNLYFEAYFKVAERRQYSMSLLPLLNSEIESYARIHNFTADIQFFYRVITAMDDAHIKHVIAKKEREDQNEEARKEKLKQDAKRQRRHS